MHGHGRNECNAWASVEMASANTRKANHGFAFDSVTDLILAEARVGPKTASRNFVVGAEGLEPPTYAL